MTYVNYPGNLQFVLAKNKVKRVMWKQARIERRRQDVKLQSHFDLRAAYADTGGWVAILQTPGCTKMLKYRESEVDNRGLALSTVRQYVPLSESSAQLTNYPVN